MSDSSESTTEVHAIDGPVGLGSLVRSIRRQKGLTQADLAAASGTGRRFIVELEQGKPTCRVGAVLHVLRMLGLVLEARAR